MTAAARTDEGDRRRHAAGLAWWCSEPDAEQSHAINKGLERATGEVFGWLNSDDVLLPGALQRIGETFAADPNLLVLSGARVFRSETGDRAAAGRCRT
ncbi:MAG: glycosyltransferase [Flavobacteriales bacterium]|nr:glycosyltransferase [Flavobacteriales bacterium]